MKTKLISVALAALLTTAGGVALAQDAPTPPQPRHGPGGLFMRADANKDGIVTRDELLAVVDARFARFDANKDGKITADERPGRGRMGGRRHMRDGADAPKPPEGAPKMARHLPADANQDGVITREEQRAQALKVFGYIDRNGDGRIDKAERENFREVAMALGGPGGPHMRGRGGHGRHGGHHGRHGPPPAGAPEAPKAQ